ncbi:hypothetical protein M885DRAFT_512503 [Pelagophyceae sp. CCMP2097]|nr:hypothetical protein M885DRAFT_512503 [Pelagophyceae sp. CCMP2097]|mmetsp:Transcript_3905/g.12008  ORF Transcript_3905/g.12008 Transcript_3905/m.12008 type:complete len:325 (-) Transcript_3905:12-986(-)
MWERRSTPDGRAFYFNHSTQETRWQPPAGFAGQVAVATIAQSGPVAVQSYAVATAVPVAAQPYPVAVQSYPVAAQSYPAAAQSNPFAEQSYPAPFVVQSSARPISAYPPPPQPPTGDVPPRAGAPRPSLASVLARSASLTGAAFKSRVAPSYVTKRGVLVLDGSRVCVELSKGDLCIYALEDKSGAPLFRAPMAFIKVFGNNSTRETARGRHTAPEEICVTVDGDLVNREIDNQSGSGFGFGGLHPTALRAGRRSQTTSRTGAVQRQAFSLFACDVDEKMSWLVTLNTVSESTREWRYVQHEASTTKAALKDSLAKLSGKKPYK